MNDLTVAVSGATGYAGGEVLRLLSTHPHLNVTTVCGHSTAGEKLGRHQPHLPRFSDLVVQESTAEVLAGHDVVILAAPARVSPDRSPPSSNRRAQTLLIVDLAADRLISARPGRSSTARAPGHLDLRLPNSSPQAAQAARSTDQSTKHRRARLQCHRSEPRTRTVHPGWARDTCRAQRRAGQWSLRCR